MWLIALSTIAVGHAQAASRFHDAAASDPARAALLREAHRSVERALDQPVRFVVERIRIGDGWAFVLAHMQRGDGAAIDYSRTRHADAARHGGVSREYAAVFREVNGQWRIEAEAIGPTDPAWLAWPEQVGAPRALLED